MHVGVAYYGGNPISSTVRKATSASASPASTFGAIRRLPSPEKLSERAVPKWFKGLGARLPEKQTVAAAHAAKREAGLRERALRQLDVGNAHRVQQKLIPFTTGDVVFALGGDNQKCARARVVSEAL